MYKLVDVVFSNPNKGTQVDRSVVILVSNSLVF